MKLRPRHLLALVAVLGCAGVGHAADARLQGAVVALFEDDELVIEHLTEIWNGSVAEKYAQDKYSGLFSLRVTPSQVFNPTMPGWSFRIAERPKAGEYRYLRFAWKKVGGKGIMLQLNPQGGWWGIRYVAGENVAGWAAVQVSEKIPSEWTVVTRDLFKDFGATTLTGIAFTPMDGTAGLFDHLYLGRTQEDLDRIDASGLGKVPLKDARSTQQLEALWKDLAETDDAKAYLARWTLVAAGRQSVLFLKQRLVPAPDADLDKKISQFIKDLDDDRFGVRDSAAERLADLGAATIPHMRKALEGSTSVEVRNTLRRLLARVVSDGDVLSPELGRQLRSLRILEQIGTREAEGVVGELLKRPQDARLTAEMKAVLVRLRNK